MPPRRPNIEVLKLKTVAEVQDAIKGEKVKALNTQIRLAKNKRRKQPDELPADWTNPRLTQLEARLKQLVAEEDGKITPASRGEGSASHPTQGILSYQSGAQAKSPNLPQPSETSRKETETALEEGQPQPEPESSVQPEAGNKGQNDTMALKEEGMSNDPPPLPRGDVRNVGPAVVSAATSSAGGSTAIQVEREEEEGVADVGETFMPGEESADDLGDDRGNASQEDVAEPGADVRPGPLNKEQLHALKQKLEEWEEWVASTAKEFRVNPLTIWVNMGIDNREKRGRNWWNMFQAVYWKRLEKEAEARGVDGDGDGTLTSVERDVAKLRCPIEYNEQFGRLNAKNLSEEEAAELTKAKKELVTQYEAMHKEEDLKYRPGDTAKAMKKAREELTDRAAYFRGRNVGIAGWIISLDLLDTAPSALNTVWGGSPQIQKYLDSKQANLKAMMMEMEVKIRSNVIDELEHQQLTGEQLYLRHKDQNEERRTECSNVLKDIWVKAMGHGQRPYRLRWGEWGSDMIAAKCRLGGWPSGLPHPGGEHDFQLYDAQEYNEQLWPALCGQCDVEIKIEKWSEEEIALAKKNHGKKFKQTSQWLDIVLVESDAKAPLLTIGNMEDLKHQRKINKAERKAEEARRAKNKLKDINVVSDDDPSSDERLGRDNNHKAREKKPMRKTKRSSSRGFAKRTSDPPAMTRPPKRKSKEYIEVSDDDDVDPGKVPQKRRQEDTPVLSEHTDPQGATLKAGERSTGIVAGHNTQRATEPLAGTLGSPFQPGGMITTARAPSHPVMNTMGGMMEGVGVPGQPLLLNGQGSRPPSRQGRITSPAMASNHTQGFTGALFANPDFQHLLNDSLQWMLQGAMNNNMAMAMGGQTMMTGMSQGLGDGVGARMMQGANMNMAGMYGTGVGQVGMTPSMASGSGNVGHGGNMTGGQGFTGGMSGLSGHSLPNGAYLPGGEERLPGIPEENGGTGTW